MKIQTIPDSVLLPATVDWSCFFGTTEEIDLANLIYQALNRCVLELEELKLLTQFSPADVADILKTIAELQGGKEVKGDFAKIMQEGTFKNGGKWKVHAATMYVVQYTVGRQQYLWNRVRHLPTPVKVHDENSHSEK